ncbi:unnamed protein product, partial [Psylliodes chrysocephalus]
MMNIKQEERLDTCETDLIYAQKYKDEDDDIFDELETNTSGRNVEIKEEIEQRSDLLPKINSDSTSEKEVRFCAITFKKEPENTSEVKATTDIRDIKKELDEYIQSKVELLTMHCDLPTLKNENTEYQESLRELCDNEENERIASTLKNDGNVINIKNRRKQYRCQKNFRSSKSRSKHIDGHFGKNFVICKFCGRFMTKMNFSQHQFIHVVKNRSRKVSSKINDVSNIQAHLKIHSNEKSFKCDVCSKGFNRKSSLQRHLIIHSNERPFKCDICFNGFYQKSYLRKHLIIHSNKKSFKCDICSKGFNQKYNLQLHLLSHNKEKLLKCDICSKGFNRKSSLKRHIFHSNERPFKCGICLKGFKQKFSLRNHLIIHSNEKSFKC